MSSYHIDINNGFGNLIKCFDLINIFELFVWLNYVLLYFTNRCRFEMFKLRKSDYYEISDVYKLINTFFKIDLFKSVTSMIV